MDNEKILGVFPIEAAGGGIIRYYDGYFTNQRLIANYTESRMWTKWYGGCLFWGWRLFDYVITVPLTKRRGMKPSTNPEEILKSDKRNFSWDYQKDIKSAEFKKKRGSWGQSLIQVELINGKPKIVCYDQKQGKELAKLMQEVMPGKIAVTAI